MNSIDMSVLLNLKPADWFVVAMNSTLLVINTSITIVVLCRISSHLKRIADKL